MDFRKLLSGQRRDPLAFCLRGFLRLGVLPYRVAVAIRNRGFDNGKTTIHRSEVPVISIGNITTGGTGKTPLVCFIARHLRARGLRVAIVSRGYGAQAGEENDEAMELARALPDVPHVQDANRVEAARIAVEELETEVILMDDGFQHRRLHRDVDIVVIDATHPFGYDHLLPRGLLREPIKSLARANAVLLSRADLVDEASRMRIKAVIQNAAPNAIWAEAIHEPASLLFWPDRLQASTTLAGKRVVIVSAIGNPEAFESTVKRCGAEIVGTKRLADHDPYLRETVDDISRWLIEFNDSSIELVCTHKDLVKLQTDRLAGHNVCAILIEMRITVGENELLELIDQTLKSHQPD